VYKFIEFRTTWHIIDRPQALIDRAEILRRKRDWPVPPKAQVYESRMTLIRPHTPLEILMTCHLVNKEAHPILQAKAEHCRYQPIRYLVDYSAAWALVGPTGTLRNCLGAAGWDSSSYTSKEVKGFVQMCTHYLSQTRRRRNGSPGVFAIEMTITHKHEIVYSMEVFETMISLCDFKFYAPTRLVVIYKSPLPRMQVGSTPVRDSNDIEELLLRDVPREPEGGDQPNLERGIFVRPLNDEAFEKHVES
jgi:hypothetical protein